MGAFKSQFIAQFLRLQPNWLAREDQRIPVVVEHNVVGVDAIVDEIKKIHCTSTISVPKGILEQLKRSSLALHRLGPRLEAHSSVKHNKLCNPQTDPIPIRYTAEPESISDATSSSYAPRESTNPPGLLHEPSAHQRQSFDHRKDDPIRFSVLTRSSSTNGNRLTPTQILGRQLCFSFFYIILRLFDRPTEEPGNSPIAVQLKKLYRGNKLIRFIYYAYTFYTRLLEEQTLRRFRAGWLEALGDLSDSHAAPVVLTPSRLSH
ncbi:hypothetical protein PILCRDRAFT_4905 [Piloderma croceum F 1598]|uniref:Uncharacterized protein n=1 Tax=Piloderma croceum (strain F 1598) TaxID=765440 RepID=A0A0C3G3D8_PILCF|nr:hypothetical protein PILCRDRAFT_4905 [Piloderma croceum F 1598]